MIGHRARCGGWAVCIARQCCFTLGVKFVEVVIASGVQKDPTPNTTLRYGTAQLQGNVCTRLGCMQDASGTCAER